MALSITVVCLNELMRYTDVEVTHVWLTVCRHCNWRSQQCYLSCVWRDNTTESKISYHIWQKIHFYFLVIWHVTRIKNLSNPNPTDWRKQRHFFLTFHEQRYCLAQNWSDVCCMDHQLVTKLNRKDDMPSGSVRFSSADDSDWLMRLTCHTLL